MYLKNQLQKDDDYHTDRFIKLIEDHLTILKSTIVNYINIEPIDSYRYDGDFYGLLSKYLIENKYHYTYMRVNGFQNSGGFKKDINTINVPDVKFIDTLYLISKRKVV